MDLTNLKEYIEYNYDYLTNHNNDIYIRYLHKVVSDANTYDENVINIYKILFIVFYFCV